MASDWLEGLTASLQELPQRLRSLYLQDRYLKTQAALVLGWILLSVITLAATFAGHTQNRLGAEVRAEMAVGGPVLLITNSGGTDWTDITYTLNGIYFYRQASLRAGDHSTLPVRRFRKGGIAGKHASTDTLPTSLVVACDEGQFRTNLALPGG